MSPPESRAARLLREMRVSLVLAMPLVLSQMSSMAMNIVDTVLAGRYGPTTLAAVGVGSAVWSVVILVSIGVLMAVPPTVSQLNGARRRAEIGAVFRQALWLALALGLGLIVVVRLGALALGPMGITEEARPEAEAFLRAISWGAPGLALYFCLRNLSEGVAWTLPSMVAGLSGLGLLVPLGYLLMFGAGLGAAGLGYAVAGVLSLQALGLGLYLWRAPRFADLRLFERFDRPRWPPIRALLALGLPMGVSVFMEGSLFVATALIIGTLGTTPMAAHQIAILAASLCFMVPLGVAMATTVRVGHAVGAGDASGLRWSAAAGYSLAMLAQTLSAILLLAGGAWLAGLVSPDPAVVSLAALLMAYAAVFQYPDGFQALSAGALRGLKDTRIPMVITVLAYWGLGLPLGAWLGLSQGRGAPGLWTGLIVGLSAAAVLLGWRFWRMAYRPLRPPA
ncbi:MATE family efflux transporter [Arenimonas fontis]|uniref:MATE family efflux transporter n=1 Tax=Arenimonas fontis TaxID=2608255 RepID=A0A5B2ZAS1_9GAMM|nr:MATE family efflux transporter [Arenimonas fontis]KAA2284643.1 MATE family efflux transporter [Arenimonas fontis]